MMAARKPNDTIAKMAVIGGCEFHRKLLSDRRGPRYWAVIVGGLSVIANPCLLHRTMR